MAVDARSASRSARGSVRAVPRVESSDRIVALIRELRQLVIESPAAWTDLDLTMAQLRALSIVRLQEPMTVGALSSAIGMSLPSGSALSDRLVRSGLLVRRDDPVDRRRVLLELSDRGRTLLERRERRSVAALRGSVRAMRPHERAALGTALAALIRIRRASTIR